MSCTLVEALFVSTVLLIVAGHAVGAWAWRDRAPQYSRWEWTTTPLYLFRAGYYQNPKSPARFIGAGLLTLGALGVVFLALVLIFAQRAGASDVCGFKF